MNAGIPQSILVLQLKRIGDLILTLPALTALREAFPDAKITLVIDEGTAGMIPTLGMVDETLVFVKNTSNFRLFRSVAFRKFSVTLDFTGNDRSLLLTGLSRGRQRIAFLWAARNSWRRKVYTDLIDSSVRHRHTVDHYLDLLAGVGLITPAAPLCLVLPAEMETSAAAFDLPKSSIVFHIGAARAEKYWPPERWAAVIQHCQKILPCVVIGGRSEMEIEAVSAIRKAVPTPFLDLTGQLDLMESARVIRGATLFIGIDSGPSHLAAALEIPQITLFGPTNPFHWRARHSRAVVLQGGGPNPIAEFSPNARATSLNDLSTADVLCAINHLLQKP